MPVTPRKVHWDSDDLSSILNSPFFNNTYDSSVVSTSSLEFINSQLVAHGFVPSPGLSLEGISNDDSARVVKCLLGMLSQRVEDMSRTEDLTTKLRNLSYDHERMISMCRAANERAANAEKETNLHKSRLTAALRNLQASETAHKQTSSDLQRIRTTLQGVRASHMADLKKKEKDTDRLIEKWQKLADSQAKLSVLPSGMRCQNVAIVEGSEFRKCQGFMEVALEEAEQARDSLDDKTDHLKRLILSAVNEVQSILYQAQTALSDNESLEAPTPFTLTTLFPLFPPTAASDKLRSVLSCLRQCVVNFVKVSQPTNKTLPSKPVPSIPEGELERLQGIITTLKEEIARSQKESVAHAAETQALFDKFADTHRDATREIGEMSIELMSAPLRDEEKERIDSLRRELDSERQRFTEAAIKFGREKADLEAERLKFFDEKRSWQVEMMLADFPPTPVPKATTSQAPSSTFLSSSNSASPSPEIIKLVPATPPAVVRRPFPVAKPFTPRMIHAYSPAKPSPLSRILMLSNSPPSPRNSAVSDDSLSPTSGPLAKKTVAKAAAKSMSTTTTSKTKTSTKPPVPRGGARRVLINSVDAPPIGKSRKARKG